MADLTVTATAGPFGNFLDRMNLVATAAGGTAPYIYLWSGISVGRTSDPSAMAFIPAAGTYTANIAVEDAVGAVARSSVTFTVAQVAQSINVWPTVPSDPLSIGASGGFILGTVAVGHTRQLNATVLDQFKQPITGAPVTWSATGSGTVDSTGLFTATSTGTAAVTVTSGIASSTVTVGMIATVGLAISFPPTIYAGVKQAVSLLYGGTFPASPPVVTASAGTVGSVTVCGASLTFAYTAQSAAGGVTFTADGMTTTATVSTTVPRPRYLGFAFNFHVVPDGNLVNFGGLKSPPAAPLIRDDTNAIVGPMQGTPFLMNTDGSYYYTVPDVAPTVDYRGALRWRINGEWTCNEITFRPTASPTPTPTPTGTPVATTITLTDADSQPMVGAAVWVASDAAGLTVVAGPSLTSGAGTVAVQLVSGTTYYLTASKRGEQLIDRRPFVAVAD